MKAALRTSYGPPEVVQISVVAQPVAKPFFWRFFMERRRPRVTVLGNESPERWSGRP
jgi:hypothetical protein